MEVVKGLVDKYQESSEGEETVRRFVVVIVNELEEPIEWVPVEMRGYSFTGAIRRSDLVQIDKEWTKGQTLHTKQVHKLKPEDEWVRSISKGEAKILTIAPDVPHSQAKQLVRIITFILILFFLVFAAFVIINNIHNTEGPHPLSTPTGFNCDVMSSKIDSGNTFIAELQTNLDNETNSSLRKGIEEQIHVQQTEVANESKNLVTCRNGSSKP